MRTSPFLARFGSALKQTGFLLAVAFLHGLASNAIAQPAERAYARDPALASDRIVFVAEGDLWSIPLAGGVATRLTTHPGEERKPSISPDGRWLAFVGQYDGADDVFVMPLSGGAPKRLTFEAGGISVVGWSSIGEVLVTTPRYTMPKPRIYAINRDTGARRTLPFADAYESCDVADTTYFIRHRRAGDNMRRYRGGGAQTLYRFSNTTKTEAQAISKKEDETAHTPLCGNSAFYYLSNRDAPGANGFNIYELNLQTLERKPLTKYADFEVRGASLRDGKIAYVRKGELYLLNTANGAEERIPVRLSSDFDQMRERWVTQWNELITDTAFSPTGDRVALNIRGQLIIAPVGSGRRVEVSRAVGQSSKTRARTVKFSHDGKQLFTFSDNSGEMELTTMPANGVASSTGSLKTLSTGGDVVRLQSWPSPDGHYVLHLDRKRRLWLTNTQASANALNIKQGAVGSATRLVKTMKTAWSSDVTWSPDSQWFVFADVAENDFEQLFLQRVSGGELIPLTSDRYNVAAPVVSSDGKWLYYFANRNLQSVVPAPWGEYSPQPFFDRRVKLYALNLDGKSRFPFLAKDELAPAEPEKKDESKAAQTVNGDAKPASSPVAPTPSATSAAATKPVKPNALVLEGLRNRLYEVPIPAGNYSSLYIDAKRVFMLDTLAAVEAKASIKTFAIEPVSPTGITVDTFIENVRSFELSRDGKKVLLRRENDFLVVDAGAKAPTDLSKAGIALKDLVLGVDPKEEWREMFNDAWRLHRDYFYDANMHGVNWSELRSKYAPLVEKITERRELEDVIAQMVSELNLLHSFGFGSDLRKGPENVSVGMLAADFSKVADGLRVDRLHAGDPELLDERSPLATANNNVVVGDVITRVNGIAANTVFDMGDLLRNQVGKQVLMSIKSKNAKPNEPANTRDIIVTPLTPIRDRNLRYRAWSWNTKDKVEKAANNRIGYVHLQAMGRDDIERWTREFYPVANREGLIVDLRNNSGGNIDSWITTALQRRAWMFWTSRTQENTIKNHQNAFRGHVVALVDAETFSDSETAAEGLKRLGIATVIGVRTYGGGVWHTSGNRTMDGGIVLAAENPQFDIKGNWLVEGKGVLPDIEVDNPPYATFNGQDAQLEAGIKFLLDKLAKEPIPKPVVPAMPGYAK